MAKRRDIEYVSDEQGNLTAVLAPIKLWRDITSERETAYLLKSKAMRRRLLEARRRGGGIPPPDSSLRSE